MYIILLFPVLLSILFFESRRVLRARNFSPISYTMMWFAIIYCIVPIYMIMVNPSSYSPAYDPDLLVNGNNMVAVLLIVMATIGIYFGIYISERVHVPIQIIGEQKNGRRVAIYMSLFGFIALMVFVFEYGGIEYVLRNSQVIRYGGAEVKSYFGAFSRSFAVYIPMAFLILWVERLLHGKLNAYSFLSMLLIFLLSLFYLYISAGRESVINFFMYLVVAKLVISKRININISMIFLVIFTLWFIVYGKIYVFEIFNPEASITLSDAAGGVDFMSSVVTEFSHQYLSILTALSSYSGERMFADYYIWAFKWMRLFGAGNEVDAISYYNTYVTIGQWKSIIPPGAIALAIYNGGVFLVFSHMMLIGFIIGISGKFFLGKKITSISLMLYIYVCYGLVSLIKNADFSLYVQSNIPLIILFVYLLFSGKIRFLRTQQNIVGAV